MVNFTKIIIILRIALDFYLAQLIIIIVNVVVVVGGVVCVELVLILIFTSFTSPKFSIRLKPVGNLETDPYC